MSHGFLSVSTLLPSDRSLAEPKRAICLGLLTMTSQKSLALPSQCWGYKNIQLYTQLFYVGARDLNFGPHAGTANALTPESSPQPWDAFRLVAICWING